jgi:hypothetical protein
MIRAISLLSAILGAMLAIAAAGLLLVHEVDSAFASVFPMPFLVLLEWAAFGIAGAVSIIRTELRSDISHLRAAWGIVGGYVPLIYLGALSIGSLALISAVLLFGPTLLLTLRSRLPIMRHLAILGIGAIGNLVLLFAFIALARVVR